MKKVGLIILNYNDSIRTIKLLNEVAEYDVWHKIVVVDNKSTDGSMENLLQKKWDKVEVISSDKNGGYSYGNNFGAKYLIENYDVDICVIANPDIGVTENTVKKMVDVIESGKYAMVAPIMLDVEEKYMPRGYKSPGYLREVWEYIFPIYLENVKKKYNPEEFGKDIISVQMLPGSLFAIAAKALEEIGYLDEEVFLYCEERILACKMEKSNLQIGLLQKEEFVHYHKKENKRISSIRQIQQVNDARMYYYMQYENIGKVKQKILKCAMKWHMMLYKSRLGIEEK